MSLRSVPARRPFGRGHRDGRAASRGRYEPPIESLERRLLLAAWPAAPFSAADFEAAIYVNQRGSASVGAAIPADANDFHGYDLRLAAAGPLRISAGGAAAPRLAFYNGPGAPLAVSPAATATAPAVLNVATASLAADLRVGVRSTAPGGAYRITIRSAPASAPPTIAIRPDTHSGAATGAFTAATKWHFHRFTVPWAGSWKVTVDPSPALDVSTIVFDSAGSPVGGDFTSPINAGGAGVVESWSKAGLAAGGTYYIRVDARGGSGAYTVKVQQTGLPVVSIAATVPMASEAMASAATLQVRRTGPAPESPLAVSYTTAGTAAAGADYSRLSGTLLIPAARRSADISVVPIRDDRREPDETVIVSLAPSPAYILARRRSATVRIADSLASLPWPTPPFTGANFEGTIMVNHLGQAVITGRQLSAGDFDGYEVFFDDPGTVTVQTTGNAAAQVALYGTSRTPMYIASPSAGNINVSVSGANGEKQSLYVGVRPVDTASAGDYGLRITGPAHGVIRPLDIDSRTGAANWLTTISNPADADFYQFTTTERGTWVVSVQPTGYLDATLVVFDAAGNPIGGTFLKPIDSGGEGATEKWIGRGLPAGTQFIARVDGRGESLGEYHIRVQHVAPPRVSVVASRPSAAEAGPYAGAFTISRDARSSTVRPLTVRYSVYGEAENGVDYVRLAGAATIPAGAYSTVVPVVPIPDGVQEPAENVKISLLPNRAYRVSDRDRAAVTITETRVLVWPAAPFRKGTFQATLYPNHLGQVVLPGQLLSPAYDIDGFYFAFDDPGPLTIETTGNVPTHLALYHAAGRPVATDEGSGPHGNARIVSEVPPGKLSLHVAVRAADGVSTGKYGLKMQGPPAEFIERLAVSSVNHAAASGSDISGLTDCDFYSFTTTHPGNWAVSVIPDKARAPRTPLDATLLVFDSAGRPVGGSFTAPVDSGRSGEAETWIGAGLPAGVTFFVRVGGVAGSMGGYGISAQLVDLPVVAITAADSRAVEASRDTARFTISRSDGLGSTFALTVAWTIGGSALNGRDYAAIPSSIVIPPGHKSVDIVIRALKDDLDEPPESVIITLRESRTYKLDRSSSASISITG